MRLRYSGSLHFYQHNGLLNFGISTFRDYPISISLFRSFVIPTNRDETTICNQCFFHHFSSLTLHFPYSTSYIQQQLRTIVSYRYQAPRHTPRMHRSLWAHCATLNPSPPNFGCSSLGRQEPPRPHQARDPRSERWNYWARIVR
jgi:hypothetical protein